MIRVIGRRPIGSSFPWLSVLNYRYHVGLLGFDSSSEETDDTQTVLASAEVITPPVDESSNGVVTADFTPYHDDNAHEETIPVVAATMVREIV